MTHAAGYDPYDHLTRGRIVDLKLSEYDRLTWCEKHGPGRNPRAHLRISLGAERGQLTSRIEHPCAHLRTLPSGQGRQGSNLRPSVLETGPSPVGERVRELVPLPFPLPLPCYLAGGGGAAGGGLAQETDPQLVELGARRSTKADHGNLDHELGQACRHRVKGAASVRAMNARGHARQVRGQPPPRRLYGRHQCPWLQRPTSCPDAEALLAADTLRVRYSGWLPGILRAAITAAQEALRLASKPPRRPARIVHIDARDKYLEATARRDERRARRWVTCRDVARLSAYRWRSVARLPTNLAYRDRSFAIQGATARFAPSRIRSMVRSSTAIVRYLRSLSLSSLRAACRRRIAHRTHPN
jgi:hypothetical protein